jgi:hypothetical protein
MTAYWIGVASREHVLGGVRDGICQLGHGKEAPVRCLKRDDVIIYYSPRERPGNGEPIQAFTAAGQILDDAPYQVDAGNGSNPIGGIRGSSPRMKRPSRRFWGSCRSPVVGTIGATSSGAARSRSQPQTTGSLRTL